jgi:diguanylate cyclase (GGDEF)-like protein/PAS domain S-box-containing protein
MNDRSKTKAQLIAELDQTRKRLAQIEHTKEGPGKSEEKYERLFELSPIGITTLDMKGVITACNPAVAKEGGYSADELVGKHFSKIAPIRARDLPKYVKMFASIIRGKIPEPFEMPYQRKDGTTGWSEVYISLLQADDRKLGVQVLQRDTTRQKQVENALRESEEKYRSVIERANDGIGIIQENSAIKFVNNQMAQMLGYQPAELIGRQFTDFVQTENIEELMNRYQQRFAGKAVPSVYELKLLKKNGEQIDVEINAGMIQYEGKPADLVFVREVTERKRAEEALEASERRYRELVEDASDVVYTTDPDGHFTYVNRPAEKLTGYSKDALLGMHFNEVVSPEWRDRVESFYQQQRDNQVRNSSLEFPILTRKGKEKWIEQKVTMIIERDQLTEVQSIVRDITERKKAGEALREMATIDPLTSLYNRRRFSEFLAHEIDRNKRYQTDLSVIMFDIDHFKNINDTHGHEEGDKVLKSFGARMKDIIRESDIIARWGGEEFMVLAVNSDVKNAQIVAEKIRADIESQHFAGAAKFTVSAGVSQIEPDDDAADLIDRADKALYHAKSNGRNQVQVA